MKVSFLMCHYGQNVEMTELCVKSILEKERKIKQIVISNNNDIDINSKYLVLNKQVKILNNKRNLGYPGGINVGLKYLLKNGCDYVFIINNDCIVKEQFLEKSLEFLKTNTNVKMVFVPLEFTKDKKKLFDLGGKKNWFGKLYHKEVESLAEKSPCRIDFAGCFLLDLKILGKVGYMNENCFLYYDDIDFCLRAKRFGYLIYSLPISYIYHGLSKTIGVGTQKASYHQTRSAIIYAKDHIFPNPAFLIFHLFLLYTCVKRLLQNPYGLFVLVDAYKDGIFVRKTEKYFL